MNPMRYFRRLQQERREQRMMQLKLEGESLRKVIEDFRERNAIEQQVEFERRYMLDQMRRSSSSSIPRPMQQTQPMQPPIGIPKRMKENMPVRVRPPMTGLAEIVVIQNGQEYKMFGSIVRVDIERDHEWMNSLADSSPTLIPSSELRITMEIVAQLTGNETAEEILVKAEVLKPGKRRVQQRGVPSVGSEEETPEQDEVYDDFSNDYDEVYDEYEEDEEDTEEDAGPGW